MKVREKEPRALTQAHKVLCTALGWAVEMHTSWLSSSLLKLYFHGVSTVLLGKKHLRDLHSVGTSQQVDKDNQSHPWKWDLASFENVSVGVLLHHTPTASARFSCCRVSSERLEQKSLKWFIYPLKCIFKQKEAFKWTPLSEHLMLTVI